MKVGFYDKKTHSMVAVEPWIEGIEKARLTMMHLALMYQSGRHKMPSPIWCVWDETEHASIFFLDDKPSGDVAFMNSILKLMV
jgi:hypothetical protein